jgi:uncharacterized membrane protein YoaK (UPF0700 family)
VSGHLGRVWPLLALTGAAASVDATSYLGLGRVFPANMTGNTVLLAVGLANRDYGSASRSAIALGGFVLGAGAAGAGGPAGADGLVRVRRTVGFLLAESALLVAAMCWWLALTGAPSGGARYGLIALFSVAMGTQSGVVTGLGVGVSTTYITGTWTAVSGWVARTTAPHRQAGDDLPQRADDPRTIQAAVLVCYFGAAVAAGYVFHAAGAVGAVIAAAAVGLGACGSRRTVRPRAR